MTVPYLDTNATSPLDAEVWRVMQDAFLSVGNASSVHLAGKKAAFLVERATMQLAELIGFEPCEIIFTSGATEANFLSLCGFMKERKQSHVLVSALEHASVKNIFEDFMKMGHKVEILKTDASGRVCLQDFKEKLRPETALVSVMAVSNLTCIQQPIDEISLLLKEHGALFHVDAAQEVGKKEGAFAKRIDALSVSAHKFYGPQGVGALALRHRCAQKIQPMCIGGGQQEGRRGGTLPTALIAGLGEAAAQARKNWHSRRVAVNNFRQKVEEMLADLQATSLGDSMFRLPHGVAAIFKDLDAEMAISALKDVASISMGSACDAAGAFEESSALTSMGLSLRKQASVLRISWCHHTDDVDWAEFKRILRSI